MAKSGGIAKSKRGGHHEKPLKKKSKSGKNPHTKVGGKPQGLTASKK